MIEKKLANDAIVEALLEVRFESNDQPEFIFGKLGDLEEWKGFQVIRLPIADIPLQIRASDPNLKFQALYELKSPDGKLAVRIGGSSISMHAYAPYLGWGEYEPLLRGMVAALFAKIKEVKVTRLGLRYINFLRSSVHFVSAESELALSLTVKGDAIIDRLNIGYLVERDQHYIMTRCISPGFVEGGGKPDDLVAAIDVDVYTKSGYTSSDVDSVCEWIGSAHNLEKEAFFSLLPDNVLARLWED